MVELTTEQRRLLIDKLPDAGNLALAGLVFGQFIGSQPFSVAAAIVGGIAWVVLLGCAFFIGAGKER